MRDEFVLFQIREIRYPWERHVLRASPDRADQRTARDPDAGKSPLTGSFAHVDRQDPGMWDGHRMIRSCLRTLTRFVTAVLLLCLLLCAVEVGLRGHRLWQNLDQSGFSPDGTGLTIPDPVTYIAIRPRYEQTLSFSETETIPVRTNEFGLRGPTVGVPKPRGIFRILCLGGESVFGTGVPEELALSSQLQQLLAERTHLQVEVLNGGCPGAGPLVHVLRLRHHLLNLQPDLVLLCLDPQDLLQDEHIRGLLRLDAGDVPAFAVHPSFTPHSHPLLNGLCSEFVTVERAVDLTGNFLGWETGRPRKVVLATSRPDLSALLDMHRLVSAGYGQLMISLSPNVWQADPRHADITRSAGDTAAVPGKIPAAGIANSADPLEQEIRGLLQQAELQERVPVLNAMPAFRQHPDTRSLYSPRTGFLTGEGNRYFAEVLARMIVDTVPGAWTENRPR